jgi:hypothetical protein
MGVGSLSDPSARKHIFASTTTMRRCTTRPNPGIGDIGRLANESTLTQILARSAIPARLRPLERTTLIAGAITIAVGVTTQMAPTANAKPISENTIKTECAQAGGIYYTSVNDAGSRYSQCCYNGYKGKRYCDSYQDGSYLYTVPAELPRPSGPTAPVTPPVQNAPITNPPPAAQQ